MSLADVAPQRAYLDDLPRHAVPRTLVLVDTADNNQGVWRVQRPCLWARLHGFVADWLSFDRIDELTGELNAGRYNLVVTPRWTFSDDADAHDHWAVARHRDRLRWVYDSDDDIFSMASVEREVAVFGADRDHMIEQRISRLRMLEDCDGITVSRPELAEVIRIYRTHDRPLLVVPNTIDVGWFRGQVMGQTRTLPPLTIGWSGAYREPSDFDQLAPAWSAIAARFPEVHFVIQGSDRAFPLMQAVPADRLTQLPWTTVYEHPATLLNVDIACCVLAPTRWNSCKSPNKWFEASLAGSASVVSPTVYGDYVTDGLDALVAVETDDWIDALSLLIEDTGRRTLIAAAALNTVEGCYDLAHHWPEWLVAWSQILQAGANR